MSDPALVERASASNLACVICHPTEPEVVLSKPQAEPAPEEQGWDSHLWGVLILLCGVLFLDGLDVSMVGVALPSIRDDLGLSTSQLQWVVSGYVLGYGGLLLLGGRTA